MPQHHKFTKNNKKCWRNLFPSIVPLIIAGRVARITEVVPQIHFIMAIHVVQDEMVAMVVMDPQVHLGLQVCVSAVDRAPTLL